MRCEQCGKDFNAGVSQCPYCHAPVHYGGNTQFYNQAARNELSIKDFFVNVFGSQPAGAGDRMFVSGTSLTTPTPDRMLQEWNKPWLYGRVILFGLLFWALCYFMFMQQHHEVGIYMLFSFGTILFPLAVLTFYWEVNIPRDIPLYRVLIIFFIGGMLSLIFTIFLPNLNPDGAHYMAAVTEEPAKVLALAIFVYWLDARYIFGGMLIGAAVGAGFSAFEDIYYVLSFGIGAMLEEFMGILQGTIHPPVNSTYELLQYLYMKMYEAGVDILVLRSLNTLGGHVTFAAIEGGALIMVKGKDSLGAKHFFDPRFLDYFGSAVAMHAAWNYGFELYPLPYIQDVVYLIISLIAVFIAFTLIQKAVTQVLDVVNNAGTQSSAGYKNIPMLLATNGPLVNALFPLERRIIFGRDPAFCNVVFPSGTPGVSRRHCVLEPHSDGMYLMDLGSSSGTFYNGQRLQPNQWVKVNGNFCLGSPNVMFAIKSSGQTQAQPNFSPPQPQISQLIQPPIINPPQPAQANVTIIGIAGPVQGRTFSDSQRLIIGREPSQCNVVLPPRTPGVSRKHCILERCQNGVYIMDVGSSAGTFFQNGNGQRLPLNQWIKVTDNFYLGSPHVMFSVN